MEIITLGKWNGMLSFDQPTNTYTISSTEFGGVSISNTDLDKCKFDFTYTMNSKEALETLKTFKFPKINI